MESDSPAKKQTPRGEHCDISNMTAAELHAELEAMAQQENEQMQRASAASFMSPSKLSAPVSSPAASPLTRSLANDEQQTASPSKQSFKPSARAGIPKRNTPVQARQFRKTPSAMDFSTVCPQAPPSSRSSVGLLAISHSDLTVGWVSLLLLVMMVAIVAREQHSDLECRKHRLSNS